MQRNNGVIFIRLPAEVRDAAQAAAAEENQYISEFVRDAIKRALAERQRKAERRLARQTEVAA